MATYNGRVTGGGLNLRASASTSSNRLIQIPNNTAIVVSDYSGNSSWYCTTYGGYSGFVMKQYVTILGTVATRSCTVTGGGLNLRQAPSTSANTLIQIPNNTSVTAQTHNDIWSSTTYSGYSGFVMSQYLTENSGSGSLSLGMEGPAVSAMQQKLMGKHYYYGHSDGVFDARTEWAVKYFQSRNGLTVDGIVGTNTMAELNSRSMELTRAEQNGECG